MVTLWFRILSVIFFQGETYGLENNKERFDDPWLFAKLRPETDVPGLYLTGK